MVCLFERAGAQVGRLDGQVALVTGAESGIGRATALTFAKEGAAVVGAGLRPALGSELLDELVGEGRRGEFVAGDVATADGAARAVASAVAAYGALNIVVNCAGIISFGTVLECAEEEWDRVIRVNLKSVFLVCREAIPHLQAAGGGSIINIASSHAVATMDHVAAYATSKAGVVGFSRQMAIDFAEDGIRVNSVIVGGVDTAMSNLHLDFLGRDRAQGRYVEGVSRLGRVAAADEIAGALLFLASSDSSFVTGSALVVDGGQLARSSG
jgi:NAD(P)-dependent dehydrogenase (short-subunit alcohol dehydrogenase family)